MRVRRRWLVEAAPVAVRYARAKYGSAVILNRHNRVIIQPPSYSQSIFIAKSSHGRGGGAARKRVQRDLQDLRGLRAETEVVEWSPVTLVLTLKVVGLP